MFGQGFSRLARVAFKAAALPSGWQAQAYSPLSSGRIALRGQFIEYECGSDRLQNNSWTVALQDIKVVGELSKGTERLGSDWFLVLVTGIGSAYQISMYAENIRQFRDDLAAALGDESWSMRPSQVFHSRAVWPVDLYDQPIFFLNQGAWCI